MDVLSGVVEVDHLESSGEVLLGQVPDSGSAISQDHLPLRLVEAPVQCFGVHQALEGRGRLHGGDLAGEGRPSDRTALVIQPGLGEEAAELRLRAVGSAIWVLAPPALGFGGDGGHRGTVHG